MTNWFVHAHFVDLARERLGQRADAMIWDAPVRRSCAEALMRAVPCGLRKYEREDGSLVLGFDLDVGPNYWAGAEFQLTTRLPQAVQNAMVGRRFGDVVETNVAGDRLIIAIGERGEGTRIFLEPDLVRRRDLALTWKDHATGPLRRTRCVAIATWREATHLDPEMIYLSRTVLIETSILAVTLLGAVGLSVVIATLGTAGIAIAAMLAPAWTIVIAAIAIRTVTMFRLSRRGPPYALL